MLGTGVFIATDHLGKLCPRESVDLDAQSSLLSSRAVEKTSQECVAFELCCWSSLALHGWFFKVTHQRWQARPCKVRCLSLSSQPLIELLSANHTHRRSTLCVEDLCGLANVSGLHLWNRGTYSRIGGSIFFAPVVVVSLGLNFGSRRLNPRPNLARSTCLGGKR